jgi:hypothetical protein
MFKKPESEHNFQVFGQFATLKFFCTVTEKFYYSRRKKNESQGGKCHGRTMIHIH